MSVVIVVVSLLSCCCHSAVICMRFGHHSMIFATRCESSLIPFLQGTGCKFDAYKFETLIQACYLASPRALNFRWLSLEGVCHRVCGGKRRGGRARDVVVLPPGEGSSGGLAASKSRVA